jgi:hypothetical protein
MRLGNRIQKFFDSGEESKKTTAIVLIVAVALVGMTMLAYHLHWAYNSDDVSQQVITQQTTQHGLGDIYVPQNTYVLKVPIYLVVDQLFPLSRLTILLTGFFINAINIVLIFFALRYFLKLIFGRLYKPHYFYLAFLFLSSLSAPLFIYAMRNYNSRTFEVGLFLALLMYLSKLLRNDLKYVRGSAKLTIGLLIAATGIFFLNDYYFLITLFITAGVTGFWLYIHNGEKSYKWVPPLIVMGGGVVLFELLVALAQSAGWHIDKRPLSFVPIDMLIPHEINMGIRSVLGLNGADMFEMVTRKTIAVAAVNLLSLGIVGYGMRAVYKLKLKSPESVFLFALPIVVFVAYIIGVGSYDIYSSRYLILLPFLGGLFITAAFIDARNNRLRGIFVAVICVTILANLFTSVDTGFNDYRYRTQHPNSHNAISESIITAAAQHHLHKGYATFWEANITTYLSNKQLNVIPVICGQDSTRFFKWLVNDNVLTAEADKSFMVLSSVPDSGPEEYGPDVGSGYACDGQKIMSQFGRPTESIQLSPYSVMYVYNYDIGSRLSLAQR